MRVELDNRRGQALVADYADEDSDLCVVLCHGFSANRRLGVVWRLCRSLAQDFSTFAFDFSGNGESEGSFSEATFSKESEDLEDVLDWLEDRGHSRFVLVGHSMGGAVCLLVGLDDPRVQKVAVIAAPLHGVRVWEYNDDWHVGTRLSAYPVKGVDPVDRERVITQAWVDDAKRLDLCQKEGFGKPVLGVYSERDERIPFTEAEDLASRGARLQVLDADHTFMSVCDEVVSLIKGFIGS